MRGPSSDGRVFDVNNRWLRICSISESENRVAVLKQIRINEPPVLFIWNPPRRTGGYEGDFPISLKFWSWLSTNQDLLLNRKEREPDLIDRKGRQNNRRGSVPVSDYRPVPFWELGELHPPIVGGGPWVEFFSNSLLGHSPAVLGASFFPLAGYETNEL